MKPSSFLLAAGLAALLPLAAQARIERFVEQTFTVGSDTTLQVETQGGDITLKPGTAGRIRVVAKQKIRTKDESEVDALLEEMTFRLEQAEGKVVAVAKHERKGSWFFWRGSPVEVDFDVYVPEALAAVRLVTSGGDIKVERLKGELNARTSGGDIELGRIDGPVDARTSGGDIDVEELTGRASLATSGGDIEVERALHILRAATSGGDIEVRFVGPLQGDSSLKTSGGDVEVKVDTAAALRLDAVANGGRVNVRNLSVAGTDSSRKNQLSGTVNGGGPRLELRTSGGSIEVEGVKSSTW